MVAMFWFKGMPKSSEVAVEKEERVKTELSERKKKNPEASNDLPLENGGKDDVMIQLSGTHLKQVDIGIDHRVSEVTLDVRHGLPFDLQSIAHPQTRQNFIKGRLKTTTTTTKH